LGAKNDRTSYRSPQKSTKSAKSFSELTGVAKVLKVTTDDLCKEMILAQRRNGAKRYRVSQGFRCAVAPLREKSSSHKAVLCKAELTALSACFWLYSAHAEEKSSR
jgi:hypothetical protein